MTGDIDIEELLAKRPAERGAYGRLRLGQTIDGWRVEAFLGTGRSAEVYRVMSVKFGGEGALKLLVDGSPGLRERFAAEVDVIRSLAIPSLPRFFCSGELDGRAYYVMEYLQPLFLPLDRAEAAPFVRSVAEAVASLHAAGFLHRDIKPANILRRRSGEPVLIDLGLVAPVDAAKTPAGASGCPRTAVGTPGFAAPEQLISGASTVRSDVFSLGKVLKACCGSKVPRRFREVISRATADDPLERYASAADFAAAVSRCDRAPRLTLAAAVVAMALALALAAVPWRGFLYEPRTRPASQPAVLPQSRALPAAADAARPSVSLERQPDEDEAGRYRRLLALAEHGDVAAQVKVAEACFHGRGTPIDLKDAVKWYSAAARAGDTAAQASLGLCLLRGWGCEPDAGAAAVWFSAAAAEGSVEAMNDLAFCYLNGLGVERDAERGFAWAMRAAERGHATSQTLVGECYHDGIGVAKNRERGDDWLQRAARQGNARAQMLLRTR